MWIWALEETNKHPAMPHIGGPQAPGPLTYNSKGDRADFAQNHPK